MLTSGHLESATHCRGWRCPVGITGLVGVNSARAGGEQNVITVPLVPPAVQISGVVVLNWTGRPLDEVAVTVTGDWARVLAGSVANVMVARKVCQP